MSSIGVHDFAIPHGHVQPTRDMVIVRLPVPPKMVGSIRIPDVYRDMAQHNVMVGRVVAMGPLAFVYKDAEGALSRQPVNIGDWVIFRPYAGTQTMGGKISGAGHWRYLSSFQDVIGHVPSDKMPDPATLLWDEEDATTARKQDVPEELKVQPRERTTYARS